MRRLAPLMLFAAFAAAGCGPASPTAPPAVRSALRDLVRAGAPGAAVFVRDESSTYRAAAGYADTARRTPMRPDDTFRIGSITKSFVATVVLRLAAEHRLSLDAPVSRYLPGLVPGGGRITIRELLNHTSGLFDYTIDSTFRAPYLAGDLRRAWTPRELVRLAVAHPPLFAPGTRYAYSNTNYVVLGLVVARVAGTSVARELRDHVFRPLGLGSTSFPTGTGPPPETHGYFSLAGSTLDVTPLSASLAGSAGAIVSDGRDVADFYRALLSGRLLRPAQLAQMETVSAASGGTYGLGLARTQTSCGAAWGHDGNFPGYLVVALSSADGARQAVVLVNADPTVLSAPAMKRLQTLAERAYCGA